MKLNAISKARERIVAGEMCDLGAFDCQIEGGAAQPLSQGFQPESVTKRDDQVGDQTSG